MYIASIFKRHHSHFREKEIWQLIT